MHWKEQIQSYDDRRDIAFPGDGKAALNFAAEHFIEIANAVINQKGMFSIALSGGSTPKSLYRLLASPAYRPRVPWEKVQLFWSDERSVPPDSPESNYHMSMEEGFSSLPVLKKNIHRMPADSEDIEEAAKIYEQLVEDLVPEKAFDLVMLGMGEDGHTASLFPKTHGLHAESRLVIANFIPEKDTWRMTLTFDCINTAHHIVIYVMGKSKAAMLQRVFFDPYDPDELPIQKIGTRTHKALWIVDEEAAGPFAKSG